MQALLFITLCRMSGIPARWQSGLYATEFYTGCHDWAQFYIEPYGWVFADPSFGCLLYTSILTHEDYAVAMLYNETIYYLKKPYVKDFEVTFTYRTMFGKTDIEQ